MQSNKKLLPTAYCLLPTILFLLLTAYCLLPTAVWAAGISTVDSSGGAYSSIKLQNTTTPDPNDDYPAAAYFDHKSGELKYSYWTTNGTVNQWIRTVVEEKGVTGYVSLAFYNNKPYISYYHNISKNNSTGSEISGKYGNHMVGALKYAYCATYTSTTPCLTPESWTKVTVAQIDSATTTNGYTGGFSSLAFDSSGNPRIAYYDYSHKINSSDIKKGALKLAYRTGHSEAISISFAASTKEITRSSGSFITDGFVAGNKIITDSTLNPGPFTIVSVEALKVVVAEALVDEGPVINTTVTSWSISTIDTDGGRSASMVIYGTKVMLSYDADEVQNIRYTESSPPFSSWPYVNIDSVVNTSNLWRDTSIAINSSGEPRLVYQKQEQNDYGVGSWDTAGQGGDAWYVNGYYGYLGGENITRRDAYYAYCTANCTASINNWAKVNLADYGGTQLNGYTSSIKIGSDGIPRIAYHYWGHRANGYYSIGLAQDLHYVICGDSTCDNNPVNTITGIDGTNNTGLYSSIVLESLSPYNPFISYYDYDSNRLKLYHPGSDNDYGNSGITADVRASDNQTTAQSGLQSGDTFTIIFSGATNGCVIDKDNIDIILKLSNGHSWLDGNGNLGGTGQAVWSQTTYPNDTLTITLSTGGGAPTVAVGDRVSISPNVECTITDANGNPIILQTEIKGNTGVKAPTPTGAVAYYKMDEGAKMTAYDSADSNHASLNNGVTWTSGISGFGLSLDGSNDYLSVPVAPVELNNAPKITIEAWLKPNTFGTGYTVINKENSFGMASNGQCAIGTPGSAWASTQASPATPPWYGGGSMSRLQRDSSGYKDIWRQVVCTYDGTTQKVYIDGILDGSRSANGNINPSNYPFAMGRREMSPALRMLNGVPYVGDCGNQGPTSNCDPATNYWGLSYYNGKMDEVVLYNTALKESDIENRFKQFPAQLERADASDSPTVSDVTIMNGYGLQAGDTIKLRFTNETNAPAINAGNINTVLPIIGNETFTGGNGSAPNSSYWTVFGSGTANIQNNSLYVAGTTTSNTGISSQNKIILSGDFDIQADFSNFAISSGGGALQLQVNAGNYAVQIERRGGTWLNNILSEESYGTYSSNSIASTATSGSLRIKRSGSTFTTYYNVGSGWQGGWTYSGDTSNMYVQMFSRSDDGDGNPTGNFDNFSPLPQKTWLDGNNAIGSAVWSGTRSGFDKDTLTITLSTATSVPTIAPGDKITLSGGVIKDKTGTYSITGSTTVRGTYDLKDAVAYWGFESNANDSVGQYNNGTLVNTPTYATGKFGNAMSFSGVAGGTDEDYVSVSNYPDLNLSSNVTVEAWVNFDATNTTAWPFVFSKRDDTNLAGYWMVIDNSTDKISFEFYDSTGIPRGSGYSTNPLSNGVWTHVVGTFDGSYIKLYINGTLDKTVPFSGTIKTSLQTAYIGQYGGNYLKGSIDELVIYNRAITADEVRKRSSARTKYAIAKDAQVTPQVGIQAGDKVIITFDAPTAGTPITITNIDTDLALSSSHTWGTIQSAVWSTSTGGYTNDTLTITLGTGATVAVGDTITLGTTLKDTFNRALQGSIVIGGSFGDNFPAGRIAYYNFDEQGGTIAHDSIGNDDGTGYSHGTLSSSTSWRTERTFKGLYFYNTRYIDVPDSPDFNLSSYTIDAWVKVPENLTGGVDVIRRIISQESSDGLTYWKLQLNDNKLELCDSRFTVPVSKCISTTTITTTINDGEWHHLAVVRDGAANQVILYIDGVPDTPVSTSGGGTPHDIVGNIQIGGKYVSGTGSEYFQGLIDEIAVYNRALDITDIKSRYRAPLKSVFTSDPYFESGIQTGKDKVIIRFHGKTNGSTINPPIDSGNINTVLPLSCGTSCSHTWGTVQSAAWSTYKFTDDTLTITLVSSTGTIASGDTITISGTSSIKDIHGNAISDSITLGGDFAINLPEGAVSYWTLDNSTIGDTLKKNSISFSGSPTNGACKFGNCYTYGASQYASVPNSYTLNPERLTVEAWVNPGTSATTWAAGNAYFFYGGSSAKLYGVGGAATVSFSVNIAGTWWNANCTTCSISGWHYYAGTYDGTNLKLYVDGALKATTPTTGSVGIIYPFDTGTFYFAQPATANNPSVSIDDVAVYNRALDATEVLGRYGDYTVTAKAKDTSQNPPWNTGGLGIQTGDTVTIKFSGPTNGASLCDICIITDPYNIDTALYLSNTHTWRDCNNQIQVAPPEWTSTGGYENDTLTITLKTPCGSPPQKPDVAPLDDITIGLPIGATYRAFTKSVKIGGLFGDNLPASGNKVAYYNFDEQSGTTAYDSIGDNHGTMTTSFWKTEGKFKGLYFDGSRYVEVPDVLGRTDFNFSSYTIDAWVKVPENLTTGVRRIISQENGTNYWKMQLNNNKLELCDSRLSTVCKSTTATINDGEWHHLAVVRDDALDKVILYIDGDATTTTYTGITESGTHAIDANIQIGRKSDGTENFYGMIDEIAIYNRALDITEVKRRYRAPLKVAFTSDSNFETGIQAGKDKVIIRFHGKTNAYIPTGGWSGINIGTYLQLSSGSWGTVQSAAWSTYPVSGSITNNTLTITLGSGATIASGATITVIGTPPNTITDVHGNAISDSITLSKDFDFNLPEGAVSYWKFDETTGTNASDSFNGNSGTLINSPVWTTTGKINNALQFEYADPLLYGQLPLYTASASSTHSSYNVNGPKDGQGSAAGTCPPASSCSTWVEATASTLAWWQADLGSSKTITRVKVYATTTGTTANYKVQTSTDGSTWTDRGSTTTEGWVTFSFTATARYVRVQETTNAGNSYFYLAEVEVYNDAAFPGYNYVQVNNSYSLNPERLTVEAWAKSGASTWNVTDALVTKSSAYKLSTISGSKNISFSIYENGVERGPATFTADASFDITQWHHYAGTYDGTNLKIYVDGVLKNTTPYTGVINTTDTTALYIAGNGTTSYLNGSIDEVVIYNRALTLEEILGRYGDYTITAFAKDNQIPIQSGIQTGDTVEIRFPGPTNGAFIDASNIGDFLAPGLHTWGQIQSAVWSTRVYENDTLMITLSTGGSPSVAPQDTISMGSPGQINAKYRRWFAKQAKISGTFGEPLPGTPVAHWKLDENIGTIAFDSVGINHGTLTNSPSWINPAMSNSGLEIGSSLFSYDFSGPTITGLTYGGTTAGYINQTDVPNELSIRNNTAVWDAYVYTDATFARSSGRAFQARFKAATNTDAVIGWYGSTITVDTEMRSDMLYGIYFANGTFQIYEDGTQKVANAGPYTRGSWYDVRIELKSTGAKYYIKLITSSDWTLLYDSNYSFESDLRPGIIHLDSSYYSYTDDWVVKDAAYMDVGSIIFMGGTGEWSLESWFYYSLPTIAGSYYTLFGSTADRLITVRKSDMHLGTSNGTTFVDSGYIMSLATGWHHIVAVGSGGTTTFYVDGEVAGTAAFKSTAPLTSVGNMSGGSEQFGKIDEVVVYSTALSADNVKSRYVVSLKDIYAKDTTRGGAGIQNGDQIVIRFDGPTNGIPINDGNISTALQLSAGSWGTITSAEWNNPTNDTLTITLQTTADITTSPTRPTITLGGNIIKDAYNKDITGWMTIGGDFGTTLPDGAIAYWKFDEIDGTIAYDSFNDYNGTLTATSPAWTAGKINNALLFDGTASKNVSVGNATALNPQKLTVEAWAKSSVGTWNTNAMLVSKRNAYILHPVSGTKNMEFHIYTGTVWKTVIFDGNADSSFDITQWHHYAGTYDGTNLKIYVDGELKNTTPYSGTISITDTGPLYIGMDDGSTTASMNGYIDEVVLYNKALTPTELRGRYSTWFKNVNAYGTAGLGDGIQGGTIPTTDKVVIQFTGETNGPAIDATNIDTVLPLSKRTNLIAYWTFDEGTGINAGDSSSYGNTGTVFNTTWDTVDKKYGNSALSFNGTSSYVNRNNTTSLNFTSAVSMSAWVKSINATWNSDASIGGRASAFKLYPHSGTKDVSFYIYGADALWHYAKFTADGAFDITQWHQYAGTFDGKTIKLYVDGVEKAVAGYYGSMNNGTGAVTIGKNPDGGNYLAGKIDNVLIFNYAMSPEEVQRQYDTPEPSSLTWKDGSGNLNGIVEWGQTGSYQRDTLTINLNSANPPNISAPGTRIGFGGNIIKDIDGRPLTDTVALSGSFGSNVLLSSAVASDASSGGKGIQTNDKVVITFSGRTNAPTTINSSNIDTILQLNDGHTWVGGGGVTVSWDQTTYSYDVLTITLNATSPAPTVAKADTITISNGVIQDLYGNPVKASANITGSFGYAIPSGTTAIAYYDFNDRGAMLYDNTSNNNNGYLNKNSPITWTTDARAGTALNFNPTNSEYVYVPDSSSLRPTRVTVEAWAKSDTSTWSNINSFVSKSNNYKLGPATAGSKNVTFQIYGGGAWKTVTFTPSDANGFDITTWHHYAGTYDGTNLRIYVDGVVKGTPTAYTGNVDNTGTNPLGIGRDYGSAYYLDGNLDEVVLYNSALSAAQVLQRAGTLLISATAYDTSAKGPNIQSGDSVVIKFNGSTNGPDINSGNIDTVLALNGHSWLDGGNSIVSAVWTDNAPYTKDTLTVTLSGPATFWDTLPAPPNVAIYDKIILDGTTIKDASNNPINHSVIVTGSFGTTSTTVISSATAYDTSNKGPNIQSGDRVVIKFNGQTNGLTINKDNIDTVLKITGIGKTWLDGDGNLGTTPPTWTSTGGFTNDTLTITLSGPSTYLGSSPTPPTVVVGDTITINATIVDVTNAIKDATDKPISSSYTIAPSFGSASGVGLSSATASDTSNWGPNIQSGDKVVIKFSGSTCGCGIVSGVSTPIDATNINTILPLLSGNSWLDGSATPTIVSAGWSDAPNSNDTLTITLSGPATQQETTPTAPNVAAGDTISINGTITDTAGKPIVSNISIASNFGTASGNVISSAVASGDDGKYSSLSKAIIKFSGQIGRTGDAPPTIDATNINTVLALNNNHLWGSIQSAVWTSEPNQNDTLTITLGSGATVAGGDTITLGGSVIKDKYRIPIDSNKVITGDFTIPSSRKAWWKFESDANDSFGTYNGTISGTYSAGRFGQGGQFDASGEYVTLTGQYNLTSNWTIEAWFKWPISTVVTNQQKHVIVSSDSGSNENQITVDYQTKQITSCNGGTCNYVPNYDLKNISTGWHHIVAVGTGGSGTAGTTKFYIDGNYVGTSPYKSASHIKYIGNSHDGSRPWSNTIDNIIIYDTALDAITIKNRYGAWPRSAFAYGTVGDTAGIQTGDQVVIRFDQSTEGNTISNLDTALSLSSHIWGSNSTSAWSTTTYSNDTLTITLSTTGTTPTVAKNDTITFNNVIKDHAGRPISDTVTLQGSFDLKLPVGAIAYWKFDTGSGTAFSDSFGSNNGTLTGGVAWDNAMYGTKGVTINAITKAAALTTPLNMPNEWTIIGWVKTPITGIQDNALIHSSDGHEHAICIHTGTGNAEVGNVSPASDPGGNLERGTGYFLNRSLKNGWHQIAAVGTGGNGQNGTTRYYVDGQDIGEAVYSGDGSKYKAFTPIGALGNNTGAGAHAIGTTIDEISVYDRPLSPTEISQYYGARLKYARANDASGGKSGIDAGDQVVIKFDGETSVTTPITVSNIDTVLKLSNGHTWLDGNGQIGSIAWSTSTGGYTNDTLTITLSTNILPPTITTRDTITLDGVTIRDLNRAIIGSIDISGDFDGAIAYYDLDEGATITAEDSVNNNNGTLGGQSSTLPAWVSGYFGSALEFNDTNAQYVTIPDNSIFFGDTAPSSLGSYTIEAWIKIPTTLPSGNYMRIVSQESNTNPTNYWSLAINPSGQLVHCDSLSSLPEVNINVASSTTTNGSATVTTTNNFNTAGVTPGQKVTGTGIATDTYVVTVSGTQLTLSKNATATGTVTLNFTYNMGGLPNGQYPKCETIATKTLNNDKWHFAAVVRDTTAGINHFRFYIDHVLEKTTALNTAGTLTHSIDPVSGVGGTVEIGRKNGFTGNPTSSEYFRGVIDNVAIYNYALSTDDINIHHFLYPSEAHASDTSNGGANIQAGDTITILFNGETGATAISDLTTLSNTLKLPTEKSWGTTFGSAVWSDTYYPKDTLKITLGSGAVMSIGDKITLGEVGTDVIKDVHTNIITGSVNITGSFDINSLLGTVAYWDFYEGASDAVADKVGSYSGSRNGSSEANKPSWDSNSKFGYGLNFSSGITGYVNLPTNVPLSSNEWTIEAWVYAPLTTNGTNANVLINGAGSDTEQIVVATVSGTRYLGTYVSGEFRSSGFVVNDTNLTPNMWHHLVAVGKGGTTKFYIDGTLKGTANYQSNVSIARIGNGRYTSPEFQNPWGRVDDVVVYSRALSDTPITGEIATRAAR